MFKYFNQIWGSKDLRNKILFTVGALLIYRLLAHITVPGASIENMYRLSLQTSAANEGGALSMLSLLTGGSTERFSIVLMGISPYINASIIIQLLTVVVPKLESISKEGEAGRRKLSSFTRWLTLPLAFLQSYGMILLLNHLNGSNFPIIENTSSLSAMLPIMLSVSAGTVLLVWLGEQITEKGIGNGISLIIFANIISQVPALVGGGLAATENGNAGILPFIIVLLLTIVLITIVIVVNEAQRRIPVTYGSSKMTKNDQSFLPIRINQAGMIPIIFAVAMISFPSILGQFLVSAKSGWLQSFGTAMTDIFAINSASYLIAYFVLVVAFTYFYVSITFKPSDIAESIQKRGGYIPGIRPGKQTIDYISIISNRLTLFGSFFLAFIALLPILLNSVFNMAGVASVPLLISGAGIIIIVGVVLDLIRQINSQLVMHDYKKFY